MDRIEEMVRNWQRLRWRFGSSVFFLCPCGYVFVCTTVNSKVFFLPMSLLGGFLVCELLVMCFWPCYKCGLFGDLVMCFVLGLLRKSKANFLVFLLT